MTPPPERSLWAASEEAGGRVPLDRSRVVERAVALADADGYTAVTMARVAQELGVTPMALYRHVPNKAALETLMVDAGVGLPPPAPADRSDWRGWMKVLARGISAAYRRHPWMLDIAISGPPATPNNLRWLEAGMACLDSTPLSLEDRVQIWVTVAFFIRGVEQAQAELRQGLAATDGQWPTYPDLIRSMVDLSQLPHLAAAVDQGIFDDPGLGEGEQEAELGFGLDRLLDGIAAYVEQVRQPALAEVSGSHAGRE